jgi:hypothetical protein
MRRGVRGVWRERGNAAIRRIAMGPVDGPRNHKAPGSAGGYLLAQVLSRYKIIDDIIGHCSLKWRYRFLVTGVP